MDEHTTQLAGLSKELELTYEEQDSDWKDSPFAWIRARQSRQVGAIGEQLIERWCVAHGLSVEKSPDSDADRLIEGRRVEIKFSTLWSDDKKYKFQQLRDQNYDVLICLGVSPFAAHAWIFEKEDIPFAELKHQHGGERGSDTWWITVDPNSPPEWLKEQSGSLESLHTFFRNAESPDDHPGSSR